ncbi:SDR family NAD(P)-dependent oxidoreductase [Kosakonia sp. BYX6]|uniref:SDR family NAD(P)-dependent oxidoreductase n=1 Tax=Kosakonia calanthes TaxID=3139408 RepID=A0ABZ3AZX5_9ENTR
MNMSGNTLLITGGTSGIGRALAQAFHARGNQVIITGRRQALLDEMVQANPGMAGFRLDVGDDAMLAELSSWVRLRFPALNVLIANAGISRTEDMTRDNWQANVAEDIITTNILGVIRTVAALLPVLKTQTNAIIMATSSALAFVPKADFPSYCASKAFLHTWLVCLRHQLRHLPIEVLELSPPYVQTALTGEEQISDPRAMPLPAYVDEVLTLLESQQHPGGEILLARDKPRRWAEKDGTFEALFRAVNP